MKALHSIVVSTLLVGCNSDHSATVQSAKDDYVTRDGMVESVHGIRVLFPDSEKLEWIKVTDSRQVDPKLVAIGESKDPVLGKRALRVQRYAIVGDYILLCADFDPPCPDCSFNWVVRRSDMKYIGSFLDKNSR